MPTRTQTGEQYLQHHTYCVTWRRQNGDDMFIVYKPDDGGYDKAYSMYVELKEDSDIAKVNLSLVLKSDTK